MGSSVAKMKLIILFLLAFGAIASASPFRGVVGLNDLFDPKCDGPDCPGGCCPEADYICCESGYFCAATEADCPPIQKTVEKDCEGTVCPGGCCPNVGWFCCPGDEYCAASEEYCKKNNIAEKLISMAAPKKLLNKIAPELNAQVDVVPMLDGSVVLEMNTAQQVKNTARKPTLLKF